jgi:hypothetical protein
VLPVLVAAFVRAKELELTVEEVARELAPPAKGRAHRVERIR